ncbi:hypothetical protein SDC9_151107 [bioreactor metagenome]|uniref:Uncharacterized protein n=1 Tax=bioreactor metagenome TaxID=1076179 RepID=A0A645ETM8_9ZZZZ
MQFDLEIAAAKVLQIPVGQHAHDIASLVHALAREERVGKIRRGRKFITVNIAARKACSGDIKFAGACGHDMAQLFIEYVKTAVRKRLAHDDILSVFKSCGRDVDGCFSRSVEVIHAHIADALDRVNQLARHSFARQHQQLDAPKRAAEFLVCQAYLHTRRRELNDLNIFAFNKLRQFPRQHDFFFVRQHNDAAQRQAQQRLGYEDIEDGSGGA